MVRDKKEIDKNKMDVEEREGQGMGGLID